MSVYSKLMKVQSELKAPKGQENKFGGYKYRSCEDILEAVKPLLAKNGLCLVITDEVAEISGRFYIKATGRVIDIDDGTSVEATAYAREEESKKGMDGSQISGSSSSYARKYCLNGIFCTDDTKDADANFGKQEAPQEQQKKQPFQMIPDDYCTICKKPVEAWSGKDKAGNDVTYTKEQVIFLSTQKYKAPICIPCLNKRNAKQSKKMNMEAEAQAIIHEDAGDRI